MATNIPDESVGEAIINQNDVCSPSGEDDKMASQDGMEIQPTVTPLTSGERNHKAPVEFRRISIPSNRFTPLKNNWMKIFTPCVQHMKLDIRINLRNRCVELKTSKATTDTGAIQKTADFVNAFMLGFEVEDALALLRLDELFIESFEIHDVKNLRGDHLSRAIGRIAGRGGKTKFTIENITKTRIVLADSKIHILGAYQNIRVARTAICNLILGSPPSKVYGSLKIIASRLQAQL